MSLCESSIPIHGDSNVTRRSVQIKRSSVKPTAKPLSGNHDFYTFTLFCEFDHTRKKMEINDDIFELILSQSCFRALLNIRLTSRLLRLVNNCMFRDGGSASEYFEAIRYRFKTKRIPMKYLLRYAASRAVDVHPIDLMSSHYDYVCAACGKYVTEVSGCACRESKSVDFCKAFYGPVIVLASLLAASVFHRHLP